MKWLKLGWDEGPGNELPQYAPYYQMKRKEQGIYQKYIDILLEKGYAYKCYCTPEEVEKMREQARLAKQPPKYSGHCANLTKEQQEANYIDNFSRLDSLDNDELDGSGSGLSAADDVDDAIYNEVVDFVIRGQKASASLIQRKFSVGYNRAARLIDLLEERGIIGPPNGSKPREVLVKLNKDE